MADPVKEECHKRSIANVAASLAKKAGTLIAKFLCQQLQLLAGTVKSVLQAQLAIVTPIVELEAVFVENFVVFPLNAAVKATSTVSKGMSKPLTEVGIDKGCKTHKNVHKQLDNVTAPIRATNRNLKSSRDAAQKVVDESRELVVNIQKAIDAMDDFFTIQCP
jgi:hypothetical protein